MDFEFKVPHHVTVTTMGDANGYVVYRFRASTLDANYYQVAFERFGYWSIDVFPETALESAEPRPWYSRWIKRKPKPSDVTLKMPSELPEGVQLPPGGIRL